MPLFPLVIPKFPFQVISFDHKTLTRKNIQGNTHILAIICHFSGWVIFKPVKDETAITTATVLIEQVISNYGVPSVIISDRAPGYTSILFSTINKILGIKHRFTATQSKRSNGAAERFIHSLNNGLRVYSTNEIDDTRLEVILPIIEISMRAAVNRDTGLSPYEILYARKMPLPSSLSTAEVTPNFYSADSRNYVRWLKNAITLINDGVRHSKAEHKQLMKENYDKKYKTKKVDYSVGDFVLLRDNRIEINSDRILTRKPYLNDKFVITEIIENDHIGPAYKLLNTRTGRPVKNLVNFHRIKRFITSDASV